MVKPPVFTAADLKDLNYGEQKKRNGRKRYSLFTRHSAFLLGGPVVGAAPFLLLLWFGALHDLTDLITDLTHFTHFFFTHFTSGVHNLIGGRVVDRVERDFEFLAGKGGILSGPDRQCAAS